MAAIFMIIDPIAGNPTPVTQTDTVAKFPLGVIARAKDFQTASTNLGAGMFQYCYGSDVTSAGYFVQIQGNQAVLASAALSASKFPHGVAAGTLSATNVYGWVQVQGMADYCRGTNSAQVVGVPMYLTNSAGILVSNVVTGNQVANVVATSAFAAAASAGSFVYQLNFPHVPGRTASQ